MTMRSIRLSLRHFGVHLSDMVMPNIGAFIAWGLLSTLFAPSGWIPNAHLASLTVAMGRYLLPVVLAYTGGQQTGGSRGALVAAITVFGLIQAMPDPALLGALLIGPACGFLTKKCETYLQKHAKQGFELLINNLTVGLLGLNLSLIAYFAVAPVITWLTQLLAGVTNWLLVQHLLPLTSLIIEPGKVLFLNNAINHGILNPLGTNQALHAGKSILFLLETNPGPGLGLLLAFCLIGKPTARKTASNALIIEFFGGIHEVYFPYVLKYPFLFLPVSLAGATGTAIFSAFKAGLKADPSPGSIFTILLLLPRGLLNGIGVLAGIVISAAVSFAITALWLLHKQPAKAKPEKAKTVAVEPAGSSEQVIITGTNGMGSPEMGAKLLSQALKAKKLSQYQVTAQPLGQLQDTAGATIFVRADWVDLVKAQAPDAKQVYGIANYLNASQYDFFIQQLTEKPLPNKQS